MDNDDRQIGRILNRREVLMLLGASGSVLLSACGVGAVNPVQPTSAPDPTVANPAPVVQPTAAPTATTPPSIVAEVVAPTEAAPATAVPACVVRPEVIEGPYYVDVGLVRSDIRSDSTTGMIEAGAPLVLTFNVTELRDGVCMPLEGATVEIWHCNALGAYSGVADPGFDTQEQNWLRGAQITGANGIATFTTIYPGWYPGRAVHIHFKISPQENAVFTSQLFFDEAFTDQVFMEEPYRSTGQRNRLNSTDNIFQELLLLTTVTTDSGYAATFDIGIDAT